MTHDCPDKSPSHVAICGPSQLVKIDDGQSVHVRTAAEWLALARADLASKSVHATPQDHEENETRIQKYGCSNKQSGLNSLQWKWRHVETLPEKFDLEEAEAALLDAFTSQGCAHVWRGDGSSCAAQIVQAVWNRKAVPSATGSTNALPRNSHARA